MKTIINKNTSKVLFATTDNDYIVAENEIAITELLTENFIKPYFNFSTRLFYEGATQEEISEQPKDLTLQDRILQLENEINEIKSQL